MSRHILEPVAWELAEATSKPPLLYELGFDGARKVLDDCPGTRRRRSLRESPWCSSPPST
ncbi:hypothetical protein [Nonomuraea polychroma]|uniref:hypothetical protein n=1 Tax=Nonomuraea polychroma TaxID=46176 RepID=UPI0019D46015|nr:hypothetical protein [Nonomuraea polychroma]